MCSSAFRSFCRLRNARSTPGDLTNISYEVFRRLFSFPLPPAGGFDATEFRFDILSFIKRQPAAQPFCFTRCAIGKLRITVHAGTGRIAPSTKIWLPRATVISIREEPCDCDGQQGAGDKAYDETLERSCPHAESPVATSLPHSGQSLWSIPLRS